MNLSRIWLSPRAAAAVVLQLEAAIDASQIRDLDSVVLNGSNPPVSRGECAQRLAALPKPVSCSASARAGRLNIDCTPIPPARVEASAKIFTLTPEEATEMFNDYQLFMISRTLGDPNDAERAQGVTAVLRARFWSSAVPDINRQREVRSQHLGRGCAAHE